MKKLLLALLSVSLLLSLAACGGKEEEKTPFSPDDAATLLESGAFSEVLEAIDADIACALYGIDETTVTGAAVYGSTGTTAEELAIFVLAGEESAQAALTALGYRVEDRAAAMASYLPNEVPKLENAILEQRGNTVLLVVASDYSPVDDFLNK